MSELLESEFLEGDVDASFKKKFKKRMSDLQTVGLDAVKEEKLV